MQADIEKGCTCAGRFWHCADKADPVAQACDEGLQCVRKNKFYAICADEEHAARVSQTGEWDMTVMPCGESVMTYRPDLLQ